MQLKKHISILFAGRGGQGVLTASLITAHAFFLSGYDVKKSDIKGIARRGGMVLSTLIAGEKIYNPKVTPETADIVVLLSKDHYFTFSDSTVSVAPTDEEVEKYRRNVNVFCLGKLSILLDIPLKNWQEAIQERFGNDTAQFNLRAFYEGKKAVEFMQYHR
jgi:indolepyruvate ferredoxin oxidoreductase beta subunit